MKVSKKTGEKMVCPSEIESGQECIIRIMGRDDRKNRKGECDFVSPFNGRTYQGAKATLLYSIYDIEGKSVQGSAEHWRARFLLESPLLMRDGENEISIVDRYMGDFVTT
jgi:hypothetical protein